MLPEFPIAQEAIQKAWNEVFFKAMGSSDPMLSQIEMRVQKEGSKAFIGNTKIQFKKAHVEYQWKPEIGKGIPYDEFFARAEQLGEEMAKQQAAICFEVLSKPGPRNAVFKKTDQPKRHSGQREWSWMNTHVCATQWPLERGQHFVSLRKQNRHANAASR